MGANKVHISEYYSIVPINSVKPKTQLLNKTR